MALTDNLVSYWKLDEASGNALDAHSTNDLTASSPNAPGAATGKVSGCRQFEAAQNRYFSRADNAALSTGDIDFSVCAWVNIETKSTYRFIVSKDSIGTAREFALAFQNGDGVSDRFVFYVFNSSQAIIGQVQADNFGSPSTNTWYFVVGWHNAATNEVGISVNAGTPNTASTSGAPADTSAVFYIGTSTANGSLHWDGEIDEVGYWKRVLTSDERTCLYNSGNGRAYADITGGTCDGGGAVVISRGLVNAGLVNRGLINGGGRVN